MRKRNHFPQQRDPTQAIALIRDFSEMSLQWLSIEELDIITSYLNGRDLVNVILIGSYVLNQKLKSAVTRFAVEMGRFAPFPLLAYNYRQLRHLSVKMLRDYFVYPLRLDESSLLPYQAMNTLKKLELVFLQAFRVLRSSEGLTFAKMFPTLEYLTIGGHSADFEVSMFQKVPQTLRSLEFKSIVSTGNIVVPYTDIFPLPPLLESLKCAMGGLEITDHQQDEFSSLQWPEQLRTLMISKFNSEKILDTLNVPLETCTIRINAKRDVTYRYSSLPPTLTSLDIMSMGMEIISILVDIPLRDGLKRLDCELKWGLETPFTIASLPPSLGSIIPFETMIREIESDGQAIDPAIRLPEAITTMHIPHSSKWLISHLPSNLKHLILSSLSLKDALEVDPQLETHLVRLERLTCIFQDSTHFFLLPSNLVYLSINGARDSIVGEKEVSAFPNTLEELQVNWFTVKDLNVWALLAKQCPSLRLLDSTVFLNTANHFVKGDNEGFRSHMRDWGNFIPSSLSTLRLKLDEHALTNELVTEWFRQCQNRMLHLRKVMFSSSARMLTPTGPRLAFEPLFLHYLPPSVKEISIFSTELILTRSDLLHKLPEGLTDLRILIPRTTFHNERDMWRDEHFQHLPRTLLSLTINRDRSLTTQFFRNIPPLIHTINMESLRNGGEMEVARQAYYQRIFGSDYPIR